MQPSGRTPSSILRKRPSQEEQHRRRSIRAKGRRVSFAPDDELETMHLFARDKNSPLPPQDTQPLGELQNLPQGQPHDAGAAAAAGGGNRWGAFGDTAKPAQGGSQQQQDHEALMVRQQQHLALQQPDGFLLLSPSGAPSEVSMELTNDTLQAGAAFGGRDETDSFSFSAAYAAAGSGGPGGMRGELAPPDAHGRDTTHNITNDIPGLSTLVEEDEELDGDGTASGGFDGDEDGGVTMELTGNTAQHGPAAAAGAAAEATPQTAGRTTRRRSRSSDADAAAAAAAAAVASPAGTPGQQRRSSRRLSQDPAAASPALAAAATPATSPASQTPKGGRSRRRSGSTAAEEQQQQEEQGEQAAAPASAARAAATTPSSASRRRHSAASVGIAGIGSALKATAPSLDPTPSPLRRITRSMASPLASPADFGAAGDGSDAAAAGSGRGGLRSLLSAGSFSDSEGFTEGLEAAVAAAAAADGSNGGGRGRRSSVNRFNDQHNRWGLVPGQDDTLDINMGLPGAGGLGDATLHHVYSEAAGTGELTAAVRAGQPLGAAAAALPGGRAAGGRRRSSVGGRNRGVRASLAAEVIPEEAAVTPAPLPRQQHWQHEQAGGATPGLLLGDDAGAEHVGVPGAAAGEGADGMDMSFTLGGNTPGLLGGPHAAGSHGAAGRQQQGRRRSSSQRRSSAGLLLDSPQLQADQAGADADGLTASLLLDDSGRHEQLPGWGHVPLAGAAAAGAGGADARDSFEGPPGADDGSGRASLPGGGLTMMTGRGSVGSNMLTMHTHRFGHTTQLLADAGGADSGEAAHHHEQLAAPHSAAAARSSLAGQQRQLRRASAVAAAAAAPGAAAGLEDCTTKLLADSTSASACGIVGLLHTQRRAPLLTSTIAGGAPMGQPVAAVFGTAAAAAPAFPGSGGFVLPGAAAADGADGDGDADMMDAEQQQQNEQSPELGARRASGAGGASVAGSPYAAAEGDDAAGAVDGSPLGHWQQQQGEQQEAEEEEQQMSGWQARSPSLSPLAGSQPGASPGLGAGSAAAAAAADGSDATLELAAGVSQGLAGSGGLSLLEDATLEDFALPPEVAAAEERPITMPFSGALHAGGGTGPIAHTPGGSAMARAVQPLTFSDFCQVVDMQFITNLRRGTSIGVADFAPSSAPADLAQALQLLSITSSDIAVLEGAMHELTGEMHAKRRGAYEQEERLGTENPPVFEAVQTARPTQLEQTKHSLILMRKACRSQTLSSWKQLRVSMEQQLADRLAQQQADLDEQLTFVQAKLQKAQQQREYAKAFHADVLKRLAADEAAQQEEAAARARVVCLRRRLEELRALNSDRQARATALQERVAESQAGSQDVAAQLAALRSRREELGLTLAATPQPAASGRVVRQLAAANERLAQLTQIQGWRLLGGEGGSWTLCFRDVVGIQLSLSEGPGSEGVLASGSLVLLPGAAPALAQGSGALNGPLAQQLLQELVGVLQPRCAFTAAPALLADVLTDAELVLGRALELAEACQDAFLAQPLLTGVTLHRGVSGGAFGGAGGQDVPCLALAFVEADQQLKVVVLLPLSDLTSHAHPGTSKRLRASVQVVVAPSDSAAAALQQQMEQRLEVVLAGGAGAAASAGGGSTAGMLTRACAAAVECLVGDSGADMVPATQ